MGSLVYDNSPAVGIPNGASNVQGAITSVYTTKIPWQGFKLCANVANDGNTSYVQLYFNGTAWGPLWYVDSPMDIIYDVPVYVPRGTVISASAAFSVASTPTTTLTLIGISKGKCYKSIILSWAGNISVPNTNVWTAITGILPSEIIRKVWGTDQLTFAGIANWNLGFGPSSSNVTTIASGLPVGSLNSAYLDHSWAFDTDFDGTNNYLWAQSTTAVNIGAYYAY